MMTPEDYVGESVRTNGMYVSFYEEENDFRYFACIVKDATACCSQGMIWFTFRISSLTDMNCGIPSGL